MVKGETGRWLVLPILYHAGFYIDRADRHIEWILLAFPAVQIFQIDIVGQHVLERGEIVDTGIEKGCQETAGVRQVRGLKAALKKGWCALIVEHLQEGGQLRF